MNELEKVDVIRERLGAGYREAKKLLDEAEGDLVQALALAEEKENQWKETLQVSGSEIVGRVKELIKEGNVSKVLVKHKGKTVLEVPVTVGAAGVLLAPQLAAIGAVTALFTRCTLEIERAGPQEKQKETADNL